MSLMSWWAFSTVFMVLSLHHVTLKQSACLETATCSLQNKVPQSWKKTMPQELMFPGSVG
jgi:hypothetical protein